MHGMRSRSDPDDLVRSATADRRLSGDGDPVLAGRRVAETISGWVWRVNRDQHVKQRPREFSGLSPGCGANQGG